MVALVAGLCASVVARPFSQKQWVTERFTEAEITADPHLQTTTLHD
jgi:hypothetical protein